MLGVSFLWSEPFKKADINLMYTEPVQTLNPQKMRASEDIRLGYALFEGLTTFNPHNFTVQPGVAKSWDISPDGKKYTFHLREDAKWSDGSPVTSYDFQANWQLGMTPDTAPYYSIFFKYIKGSVEYEEWGIESRKQMKEQVEASGENSEQKYIELGTKRAEQAKQKFNELVAVDFPDEHTVVVELYNPTPFFLEIVGCWPLFPAHRPTLEKFTHISRKTGMISRNTRWTMPENMVNNGPYLLKERKFAQTLLMERNPHYWNQDIIKNDSVRMLRIKSKNAKLALYTSGEIDVYFMVNEFGEVTPDIIQQARDGKRNDVHETNAFGTYYYVFNCRDKLPSGLDNPFKDVRVRQAFNYATDKKEVVEDVTRLYQQVATVMVPRGAINGYESPEGLPYDPEKAQKLLADAGYPGGRGFPVITILYNTGGGHENTATAIARQWEKTLGVQINQEAVEFKILLDRKKKGDFMVARSGWFGDYGDPTTFLDMFMTGNVQNDGAYSVKAYDDLLEQASKTIDPQKRFGLLTKAESILMNQDIPAIPIYFYKTIHLFREGTTGVSMHPRNLQMFHYINKRGGAAK